MAMLGVALLALAAYLLQRRRRRELDHATKRGMGSLESLRRSDATDSSLSSNVSSECGPEEAATERHDVVGCVSREAAPSASPSANGPEFPGRPLPRWVRLVRAFAHVMLCIPRDGEASMGGGAPWMV